jgi:hypothetical protein
MKKYYIVIKPHPWLLCERAVETDHGYLLYEYDPKNNTFVDSGYVKSLESLEFAIRARYGFHQTVHVASSFEEAVQHFDISPPRIINIARYDVFCVSEGDVLFHAKWDYDENDNFFIKRFEWRLDGEEPKSIDEALERLSNYAVKHNKWIVRRYILKEVVAYEVYPDH